MPLPKDPEKRALALKRMSEAQRGRKHSPETRAKMSKAQKGRQRGPRPDMLGENNPMHRPEVQAKHPMLQKGRPKPLEQREKIAESLSGRKYPVGWGRSRRKPGYKAAHRRLCREYGPIKTQTCEVCSKSAKQWALLHEAPYTEVDGRGRRYSLEPSDYVAMCVLCHKRYDTGNLSL